MAIITRKDVEIGMAYQELKAIAQSDFESAYGQIPSGPRIPSRAIELYDDMVAALEAQARADEEFFEDSGQD
jgi:hypothetical protein